MKLLSRNPDKPKKQLETTIGKIIYGFLLFAPLLSILVTCMYVTFNKNAFESYSGNETITNYEINYKYDSNEVNSIKDLIAGNIYELDLSNFTYSENISFCFAYMIKGYRNAANLEIEYTTLEGNIDIKVRNNNYLLTQMTDLDNSFMFEFNLHQVFIVQFKQITSATINYLQYFHKTNYNEIESVTPIITEVTNLDNAFEYGTYKVENNNLYNWAKNTGTYDVLHNTTQLLGIENTFIPMLMAYWLLISVIYFIYDIALMLIMVVHRKIHELQESI